LGTVSNAQGEFVIDWAFTPQDTLVFSHVGYQLRKLTVASLRAAAIVRLEAKPVPLEKVEVEANPDSPMAKEIPAAVSTVLVESVVAQAAADLGDYIQRDASVKIDETSAGQKFVSIRGSNADEVLVVYDGIRLNSANTNTFDLAQIDLTNLAKVEIIKGSNTILFGEGAFGGVLNIVPKKIVDYHVSVAPRVGTYTAKELALNLHKQSGRWAGAYAFSHHDTERRFGNTQALLANQSDFHTLWGSYAWGKNKWEARLLHYNSDFNDPFFLSQTADRNNIAAVVYEGSLWYLKNFKLAAYRKGLDENITRSNEAGQKIESEDAEDQATVLRAEKSNHWGGVNLTLTYEHSRSRFEAALHRFSDALGELVINPTALRRKQNSFFGILKNRLDVERKAFRYLDWDFSWRIDWPETQRNITSIASLRPRQIASARKSYLTYKFAFNGIGEIHNWRYNAYIINGDNVKFPTLQQLFYFDAHAPEALQPPKPLYVEENIGTEAGCRLDRDLANAPTPLRIQKAEINFAVFRNSYAYKIVEIANRASFPRPVNTQLAWIRGFESRLSVKFLRGAIVWEGAFLRLKISDPSIFRFKPEKKITTDLWLNWRGFSFNSHAFYEGEQTALILAAGQSTAESTLPARWDVDLSLQKTLMSRGVSGFLNLGMRNLRNSGRSELSGFFLQDRRWYLSLGARI
jgi:outer membrane receptor protein involved in Fe transport